MIDIEAKETLASALAGNLDLDTVTFDYCKKFVDEYILIDEEEII